MIFFDEALPFSLSSVQRRDSHFEALQKDFIFWFFIYRPF
jgi:hypothetical protein